MNSFAVTGDSELTPKPWTAWIKYGAVFTLLWVLLTQGVVHSWIIGILVVPLATWFALRLTPAASKPRQAVKPGSLLTFIPFFLVQSVKGGWESAMLALHPRKGSDLQAGFIRYQMRLPPGRIRLFFTITVSLLPGTVSASWQDDLLIIHALDTSGNNLETLAQCESQIASLFGIKLAEVNSAMDTTTNSGDKK